MGLKSTGKVMVLMTSRTRLSSTWNSHAFTSEMSTKAAPNTAAQLPASITVKRCSVSMLAEIARAKQRVHAHVQHQCTRFAGADRTTGDRLGGEGTSRRDAAAAATLRCVMEEAAPSWSMCGAVADIAQPPQNTRKDEARPRCGSVLGHARTNHPGSILGVCELSVLTAGELQQHRASHRQALAPNLCAVVPLGEDPHRRQDAAGNHHIASWPMWEPDWLEVLGHGACRARSGEPVVSA